MKIILFVFCSLFLFSYSDFISDGNDSRFTHFDHIVHTSESKIYLAIGHTPTPVVKHLIVIDTSGANIEYTEIGTLEDPANISKFISLKDTNDEYDDEFILAGDDGAHARLIHFSYTRLAGYAPISDANFSSSVGGEVASILDIVQKRGGGNLFFVSRQNAIFKDILNVVVNGFPYVAGAKIYDRYLRVDGVARVAQSYLAEIDRNGVGDIIREFSYNMDSATDINAAVAIPDTFFTLGFDSSEDGGDITIFGSAPVINTGTKIRALSVNASVVDTTTPTLDQPALIAQKYQLLQDQPIGTLVDVGSFIVYAPEYNDTNTDQILSPAVNLGQILPANITAPATSFEMTRIGNVSKLVEGYYAPFLGPPFDDLLHWLDVNCSEASLPNKYIIPWSEAEISAITDLINQKDARTSYELCITNNKFLYQQIDANQTRIKRKWEYIFESESIINWMQDIPNALITGSPPQGRIETIVSDNTSMAMLTQGNATIGGINLLRIIDSSPHTIADRVKWHKTYNTGSDSNNESKAFINGPNLLKTIADDFLVAGQVIDNTRDEEFFDCMVIKVDKNGNELWTKNLGGFHNDNCYSVVLEKNNTAPFYNDYVAVGSSGTRNALDADDGTSFGVKFRDEGTLLHLSDGWSLITNGTDRNITAQGKKDESNTMSITNLGAHKSYFQFIKNQWLINKYPIEPLTGFWIYTIDGRHDIFLEGNLLEQKFQSPDTGWTLLGTGVQITNTKRKFNLSALWKFKNGRWIENPIEINPGEGFWAKKKR